MAIYQIPTDDVGVTKTFAGTIKDSANNPIEGAVIALRRKGGSDYVAYTETDANGDYSFTVDADGDFVIGYKLSHDPDAALIESDEIQPARPYTWYDDNRDSTAYYACVGVDDFPQSNGSPATFWSTTPTFTVIDGLDNSGPGQGAVIQPIMATSGYYKNYSSRVAIDGSERGTPLKQYKIVAWGKNYNQPYLKISGTKVNVDLTTESFTYTLPITGKQLELGIGQIESYWGSDRTLWGSPQSDYSGGYFVAALPGEQDRFDFDTTDYDESIFTEAFTNPDTVLKHGMQLYYKVIYGPGGVPGAPTGDSTTSAIKAQQAKVISPEELDILKGYFGKIGIVAELTGQTGLTATTIANTLNFGYQMTQAITTYLTNVRNNAGDPWDLSVGYTAGYSGTNSSVFTNIYREWQSFQRQKKGTDIPEADFGTKVFPILQKMGMTTVQTPYDGGWRTWTFSTSGVTSRAGL
jgi:hypothetical protein